MIQVNELDPTLKASDALIRMDSGDILKTRALATNHPVDRAGKRHITIVMTTTLADANGKAVKNSSGDVELRTASANVGDEGDVDLELVLQHLREVTTQQVLRHRANLAAISEMAGVDWTDT